MSSEREEYLALAILMFGVLSVCIMALAFNLEDGPAPEPITITTVYPCPDGRVASGHITPAGDSLFTVLCPQGGEDGEH